MKLNRSVLVQVLTTLVLSISFVTISNAACTSITSLPYAISSSGSYCLTGNRSVNTQTNTNTYVGAITVSADDVTLDLGGFEIKNTNSDPLTNLYTVGVLSMGPHSNITIKNGRINGYGTGLYLYGRDGAIYNSIIENITIYNFATDSIRVNNGFKCIIRNSKVFGHSGIESRGIEVSGDYNSVIDNEVKEVVYGITASGSRNIVDNNRVTGSELAMQTDGARGIHIDYDGFAVNNRINSFNVGINSLPGAKYRDNLTINCTTPYTGWGTDAGNNN